MGPIIKQWISEQTKLEILTVIESSRQQGVSVGRSCVILAIEHRRVGRRQHLARRGPSLASLTPGPKEPLRRMLPEALIVFDRFHSMKLMNEKLDDLRRQLAR